MKKVININLGGFPHTIDDDAFATLDKYLNSLKRHFKGSTGYENIMQDIEVRMSELLSEKRGARPIIELKDVYESIAIMGKPEQLTEDEHTFHGADSSQYATGGSTSNEDYSHHHYGASKRLYRDEDRKVIAGVCSGLSAYFGIKDPLWIRLIFVLAVLSFGFGFLPYIILWIAVPLAKTSGEKLAMSGEPVNINSIANKIQDDLSDLSKRISDLGQEFRNR